MIKILRIEESDQGTIGVMLINREAFCCTLEPPDMGNKKDFSCIPLGRYTAARVISPKYGVTFEIIDVPGRTHILFHPGCILKNTLGCVLLGQYFGKLLGDRAVLNSGLTFSRFMEKMAGKDYFKLNIVEA